MSLQSKYATVVATELRHHAVWEPGEPVRLGDYGTLQHGRFSVQGSVKDDFGLDFEVIRSRKREYAFRSDGVSESRGDARAAKPGATTELRVGFRRADALYVSSPSAWTEHIKGLGRLLAPLKSDPQWRPEWVVVTRLYMASPAIILLSNADNADVKIHLGADGVAVAGDAGNEVGEQGSVALQLTGVHGALFMGLHRVTRDEVGDVLPRKRLLSRVMVLAGAGLVGGGALASWLVIGMLRPAQGVRPTEPQALRDHPTEAGDAPSIKVAESAYGDRKRDAAGKGVMPTAPETPQTASGGHEESIGLGSLGQVGFGGGTDALETEVVATGGDTSAGVGATEGDAQRDDGGATAAPVGPTASPIKTPTPAPATAAPPAAAAPSSGLLEGLTGWIGLLLVVGCAGVLVVLARLRRRLDEPIEAVEPAPASEP